MSTVSGQQQTLFPGEAICNKICDKVTSGTCGSKVEWLTCQTSNLRITSHMGSNPVRDKKLFLDTDCSVLAGNRNRFMSVSIS